MKHDGRKTHQSLTKDGRFLVAGVGILMVEQNAKQALAIADKGFVLAAGQNRFTDTGAALLADPDVAKSFLGG